MSRPPPLVMTVSGPDEPRDPRAPAAAPSSDGALSFDFSGQDAYDALSAALADAVVVLGPGGEVAFADQGLTRIVGLGPDEVVRRPFLDLVHPDDAVQREPGGFWASALPFEREFRMQAASGAWVWVRAASPAVLPGGGRPETLDRVLGDRTLLLIRNREDESTARDTADLVQKSFDAVNNLVVVADLRLPDAPLVIVNQNFLDTTGYAREEVIGQNCRFLQYRGDGTRDDDGDGQGEALATIRAALAQRGAAQVVLRNYRKDGSLFYNRLFLTPIHDGSGQVTHVVGVQNDVTGEVREASEAQRHRGLVQSFFDSAPFLMGVVELRDGEVCHLAANAAAVRLFRSGGAHFEDVDGATPRDLGFTDDEADVWRRHVQECAASAGPVTFDTQFPWGGESGEPGVRDLTVVLNVIGDGRPTFSYVAEDVTDRVSAERERQLLAAAVEQAAESIIVTDAELDAPGPRTIYANRAHCRLFGYGLDEIVGRSPRMYQGPETDRAVLDRIRRRLEAGEEVNSETVNYRKDGTAFTLQWEIAPVRGEDGRITHWVGTQRDVTERRRLEHEVLVAAEREQERMARDIHDGLGQVLTGSAMMLSAAERELAADGRAELAADLARIRGHVSDALDQARAIARGLFPVEIDPDGLAPALRQLCEDVAGVLGVACTFEAGDRLAVASSESAGHLYRIVQEATTNAVRHGRARAVDVTLSRDGDDAVLAVRDDGSGISEAAVEGGGGLGLRTMAYRARRVGGTLEVQPADGGGTVVRVRFPVAD